MQCSTDSTPIPEPGWGSLTGGLRVEPASNNDSPEFKLDRMLIVERLYWYAWAFGERQAFALADCLTEDATWEENIMDVTTVVPHVGRAAIVDFMTGFWRLIGGDPGTSTGIDLGLTYPGPECLASTYRTTSR